MAPPLLEPRPLLTESKEPMRASMNAPFMLTCVGFLLLMRFVVKPRKLTVVELVLLI